MNEADSSLMSSMTASEYDGSLRLRVEGLHFTASNIAFWIAKKTGFLPYEDAGLLDVTFGPKGISFDVTLENASEDDQALTKALRTGLANQVASHWSFSRTRKSKSEIETATFLTVKKVSWSSSEAFSRVTLPPGSPSLSSRLSSR
jgi:hypothetical protein